MSITQPSGEVRVNPAFCDLTGYSFEELQGRPWQAISHPDDLEVTSNVVNRILSKEQDSARFVKRYLHKSGSVIWADVSTTLRRDQSGQPLYFITIVMDLTARQRAEDALRESEARFRRFIEKVPLPMFHINHEQVIDFRNDRFVEVLGYTTDDAPTAEEWWRRAYPDPQYRKWVTGTWGAAIQRSVAEARDIDPTEYRVTCKSGEVRVFEISGILLGEGLLATFLDLTERRRAEDALRESLDRFELAAGPRSMSSGTGTSGTTRSGGTTGWTRCLASWRVNSSREPCLGRSRVHPRTATASRRVSTLPIASGRETWSDRIGSVGGMVRYAFVAVEDWSVGTPAAERCG